MKFVFRVESPLHVGNGESLSWLDYWLEGRRLHVLDWPRLIGAMTAGEDGGAAIDRLAEFTDSSAKRIKQTADQLHKAPGRERSDLLRKVREETGPWRFFKDHGQNEALAKAVRAGEYDRYQAEFSGGRLDRLLEVREQAKDAAGKPTVPATALRGQIRTALAHAVLARGDEDVATRLLKGGPGNDGWERGLENATPGRARFLFGEDVEAAVFRPPSGSHRRRSGARDDASLDLMQFLIVSEPLKSRSELEVVRTSPFQFSLGKERRIMPLQPSVMEVIMDGSEFEFELRADTAPLLAAARADEKASYSLARPAFWVAFERVFGVTRDEAKSATAAELEERMISAVEVSLAMRSAALLERERTWLDRIELPKEGMPRRFLDDLEKQGQERLPLRLGTGSGLHSVTVLPSIESSPALAEPLARVLARAGLGLTPRARRERAEHEKTEIERARREADRATHGHGHPKLRDELLGEHQDPSRIPVSRRFTMEGGQPGLYLGFGSLARGELTPEGTAVESVGAKYRPPPPDARRKPEPRDRGGRDDRDDRGGRGDHGDRGGRRAPPKRRKAVPDRLANKNEIDEMLKRFGPRH